MKFDKEIFIEYCQEMDIPYPSDERLEKLMLSMVRYCRRDEPRIDSGLHLIDYSNICDEDDNMDTFYGPDYFKDCES